MKLIQVFLIIGFLSLGFIARRKLTPYTKATARLALTFLIALLTITVLAPNLTEVVAHFFGVGRGTDLISYFTTFCLLGFALITLVKIRMLEAQITILVRKLAIKEANENKKT